MITGKNGAGKSTLLDAITFALFKKPIRKIKIGQLVNSINKKDTVVEIEFEDASGHDYKVVRGLKPNIFEIYRDGEMLPLPASIDDYQSDLEKNILRLNYKTFKQVDVLSSTGYVPFMELTAGDRRAVVEDLLDGRVYGLMSKLAKAELDEHNKTMARVKVEIDSLEREERTLINTVRALESTAASTAFDSSPYLKKIDEEKAKIAHFSDLTENYQNRINELQELISAIPIDADIARENYDAQHQDLRDTDSDVFKKRKYISGFKAIEVCETCLQKIDESHREHVESNVNKEIDELQKKSVLLQKRVSKLFSIVAQHGQYNAEIKDYQQRISVNKSTIATCERLIDDYQRTIDRESNRPEVVDNTAEITKQLAEHRVVKQKLEAARDQYDAAFSQANILKKAIAVCSDSGIKAKIVSKYLGIINSTINFYLQKMDMFVDLHLDDQFNETIKARYRDDFSYESFSMGQKARIDLAILLTWRKIAQIRNSVASNILIFDEAFDGSLDNDARSELLEILQILNEENITVIVISHNETHKQTFPKVLEVSLEGNFSVYNELK